VNGIQSIRQSRVKALRALKPKSGQMMLSSSLFVIIISTKILSGKRVAADLCGQTKAKIGLRVITFY
jgi:hypothetical protein